MTGVQKLQIKRLPVYSIKKARLNTSLLLSRTLNKKVVYFEVSVKDQVKIHENYKIVQSQVNEVEKIKAEIDRNNPVSQFILGAVDGVKDNLVGTATMIAHPLETLGAIKDVAIALGSLTAEDVSNITEAVKGKIKNTFTTRDGINSIPYGAGYAVGMIATDIVIGKGVGIALEAVKEIPAIKNLLTKLGDLKSLTTAKIAEKFSDEAASLASQRARKALATTVYSGIPVDVLLDMAIVAGNKLGKGVVKFTEFSKQMVAEFGDKIKPYVEKLYREGLIELDLSKGKQILSSSGKVIDDAIVKEAKEKVFDLVKNNKPIELEKYFEDVNNKYGSEMVDSLKKSRDSFVDALQETERRVVDTHDLLGGHTRDKHIGRSENWLRNRLNEPNMKLETYASSFKNEETANRVLGQFVKSHENEIQKFLKQTTEQRLQVVFDFGEPTGVGVTRGKGGQWESTKAYVMIVKDNSEKGWHAVTAYPTLQKEMIK